MKSFLLTVFLLQTAPSSDGYLLSERFVGDFAERDTCERAGSAYISSANMAFEDNLPDGKEALAFYVCSGDGVLMELPRDRFPNWSRQP